MRVLIFGAGGVGSVLGLFLARSGHDVSLLGRAWHIDAIRKKGLLVTGIWGDYASKAFDLYTSAAQIVERGLPAGQAGAAFDLVILTVKAYDTARAVEELLPLMGPATTLLTLQNGLGNIEEVLARVPPEKYLVGRLIFGVEIEPGVARVTVQADPVAIGPAPGGAKPLLSPIEAAHLLSKAKVPAVAVQDVLPVIWAKAIYNCALNGICSLEEMTYGKILEQERTREAMRRVVRECYAVAAAKGVRLEPATADAYVRLLEEKLLPQTSAHYPSMLQDLRKGKRTDIDALNGAIGRMGRESGVPTPENDRITGEIRHKEDRKIQQL